MLIGRIRITEPPRVLHNCSGCVTFGLLILFNVFMQSFFSHFPKVFISSYCFLLVDLYNLKRHLLPSLHFLDLGEQLVQLVHFCSISFRVAVTVPVAAVKATSKYFSIKIIRLVPVPLVSSSTVVQIWIFPIPYPGVNKSLDPRSRSATRVG